MIVKIQYQPNCPRCDKLLEELMIAGIRYGFEVLPELVDVTLEPFYTKDSASKIYNEEWIKKHGSKKQKELYKKAKHIVDMLGKATATPVIEITWNYGLTDRSIVIKGFSEETGKDGIRNIVRTVLALIGVERRTATSLRVGRR